VSPPAERVLGWRIWRLRDRSLRSLVIDYRWVPGENRAACMPFERAPCSQSPGQHCNCGFWAAWSPRQALSRTCATVEPPWQVLGLVAMSGAVVGHGADGLRAERATLRCLCADRPWAWLPPVDESGWGDELRSVAADYDVPLLSLSNAESLRLSEESGPHNFLSTTQARPVIGAAGRAAR